MSESGSKGRPQREERRGAIDVTRALLVVVVAAIVGIVVLAGLPAPSHHSGSTTTVPRSTTTTLPPAQVKVQVYNGTSVNHAATTVSTKLQGFGWNMASPTTSVTVVSASVVYYATGYGSSAVTIAHQLGLGAAACQPLVAGSVNPAQAANINVVVVVGPDLVS